VNTPEQTANSAEGVEQYPTPGVAPELSWPSPKIDPDNPPWGVPSAILALFLSVAYLLLLPNLFVLPYLYYQRAVGVPMTQSLLADKTLIFLYVLGVIPVHLLTFATAWALVTRFGRFPFLATLGWGWSEKFGPRTRAPVLLEVLLCVALAILLFFVGMFLIQLSGGQDTDLERIIRSSKAAAYTIALVAVVTAPVVEEIIYRGLLYSALQRAIGVIGAVIIVATLFAGAHVYQYWPNLGAVAAVLLLSLCLTLVRAGTRRLLPCFVIHLAFNGIQAAIIVLGPFLRQPERVSGHEPAGLLIMVSSVLYSLP
jgi:uncharacterized protein